jgi:hypothetical protein
MAREHTHADSHKNTAPLGHMSYAATLVRDPGPLGLEFSVNDVYCAIYVRNKNSSG